MKSVLATLLGGLVGLGAGVGLTLHQAETTTRNGEPRRVVSWVYRNRVVESPVLERCLVVGLGCGFLGALAGNRLGAGGGSGPAVVGAILLVGFIQYIDTLFPKVHGRASDQSQDLLRLFAVLLGAAGGAEASLRVQARRPGRPS